MEKAKDEWEERQKGHREAAPPITHGECLVLLKLQKIGWVDWLIPSNCVYKMATASHIRFAT